MKPAPRPLTRPIYWDAVFAVIGCALFLVLVGEFFIWFGKRLGL